MGGWRLTGASWLSALRRRVGGVTLLLDQAGAERGVQAALEIGAVVVGQIDEPGQLHEAGPEVAFALAAANVVLDVPQPSVDLRQLSPQRHHRRQVEVQRAARLLERLPLGP